ncbi:MAG: SDR family oxidoreductase, partial [Acidimicrobiales bacterium]
MELRNRVAVVTGAASGIGRALAQRFAAEGARGVVVADLDTDRATTVADELGDVGLSVSADVSVEADVRHLVAETERRFGAVDLFCANAGVIGGGDVDAEDELWERTWKV